MCAPKAPPPERGQLHFRDPPVVRIGVRRHDAAVSESGDGLGDAGLVDDEAPYVVSDLPQGHRAAADDRAQPYLQPAVTPDVIERRPLLQRRLADRAGERDEIVRDQLGRPARAGGRQHPFGQAMRRRAPGGRTHRQFAPHRQRQRHGRRGAVMHDGIGLRRAGGGGELVPVPSRRRQHEAAHTAVEFDQGRRRQRHVAHGQQHAGVLQPIRARPQRRPLRKRVERDRVIARRDDAPAAARPRDETPQAERFRQEPTRRAR